MFESIETNKKMIIGAYKKLKLFYYYDKSILYNKVLLSTWEHSDSDMDHRIHDLAEFLCSIESDLDNDYLSLLMKKISLIPVPKSFSEANTDNSILQNVLPTDRKLTKVNFYIAAPVELLILDTIWSLLIGKIAFDHSVFTQYMYANRFHPKLFNYCFDLFDGIDFSSNRMFKPYFKQYSLWRNNAIEAVKKRYDKQMDSILISLDIKSYYYSVVFDFDNLSSYLKDDPRVKQVDCLTTIIQNIHIAYTAEMQKYRGNIPADCKKGQSALPIGLISSMLIANIYLKDLDTAIISKISPAYYGRYVDDVILVVNRTDDIELLKDNIIHKIFTQNKILEPTNGSYKILVPIGKLSLQEDKVRCIYFDHTASDAMIKLLCDASDLKPSMSDGFLMPDIDLSKKSFDECAHSIDKNDGALKVRDFLFTKNNYTASLFLNDLIRASKNVDIEEPWFYTYISEQLTQILRFYSAQQGIEFRSSWTNIFTLILINHRYDYFLEFFDQTYRSINNIEPGVVDSVAYTKLDFVVSKLKTELCKYLLLSATIAIAPFALGNVEQQINNIINLYGEKYLPYKMHFDIMFSDAKDVRKANMFNNHLLAFPLLSYATNISDDLSLVEIEPQNIPCSITELSLDKNKLYFVPRFIHLDELFLWRFIVSFSKGGNPFESQISNIINRFIRINNITAPIVNTIDESEKKIGSEGYLQVVSIHSQDYTLNNSFKVSLASIYLDEENDVSPVLTDPRYELSPKKKSELYKMLNEAKNNGSKMIVFPEFFIPIQWVLEILIFSRKNQIAVLGGLRYMVNKSQAYNYIAVLQPFKSCYHSYSIPLFREKNYYAPAEIVGLAEHKLRCVSPAKKSTQLICWNDIRYSNLMCYELTNIEFRYALRRLIDLLVVPELNRDTNYFSNIVESTTRDLHAFVIQVNTSKYGDSRITGPYNTTFKDIIMLKGGEDNIVLSGIIDIDGLIETRRTYKAKIEKNRRDAYSGKKIKKKQETKKIKDPTAGFDREVFEQ